MYGFIFVVDNTMMGEVVQYNMGCCDDKLHFGQQDTVKATRYTYHCSSVDSIFVYVIDFQLKLPNYILF